MVTVFAPPVTATGDLAVCTLTDHALADRLARHPRVRMAGALFTANLGIEELVRSVVSLPAVHCLVVCGRDSSVFRPGQSLLALAARGCDGGGRILGATGYRPHLRNLPAALIAEFRRRVRVVDLIGCTAEARVAAVLDAQPSLADPTPASWRASGGPRTIRLPAGGRRIPTESDVGFFVVRVDDARRRLVLRHYAADLSVCHEMTSHSAEALLLGAVRHGLLGKGELSHAGYLGAELAKAETALRLRLRYIQDRPLLRTDSS